MRYVILGQSTRRRIWTCVVFEGQRGLHVSSRIVCGGLGVPVTARLDKGLIQLLSTQLAWLPETVHHQLILAQCTSNILSTLGESEKAASETLPLVRVFEAELHVREIQISSSRSPIEHILLLGCRMILYTLALSSASCLEEPSPLLDGTSQTQIWIIRCLEAAEGIVDETRATRNQLTNAPSRVCKTLINAICYMFLLKHTRHSATASIDPTMVDERIRLGVGLLQDVFASHDDFASRACALFDRLSLVKAIDDTRSGTSLHGNASDLLPVKSRMGANVWRSLIFRAKEFRRQAQDTVEYGQAPSTTDELVTADWDVLLNDVDWNQVFPDMAMYCVF